MAAPPVPPEATEQPTDGASSGKSSETSGSGSRRFFCFSSRGGWFWVLFKGGWSFGGEIFWLGVFVWCALMAFVGCVLFGCFGLFLGGLGGAQYVVVINMFQATRRAIQEHWASSRWLSGLGTLCFEILPKAQRERRGSLWKE